MNKLAKVILVLAAIAGYALLLRYVAPCRSPYFVLGIAVIGLTAWLLGITAGLAAALLLTPLSLYIYGRFEVAFSYSSFASSPAYIALQLITAVALGMLKKRVSGLASEGRALQALNDTLQSSLAQVREMGGVHSLCTSCKSILDDDGTWKKIDTYLKENTKMEFSHGICPDCAKKYDVPTALPKE